MKRTCVFAAALVGFAAAFAPSPGANQHSSTALNAEIDRRNLLSCLTNGALATAAIVSTTQAAGAASYSQTYLTEPTDEFKANEERAMAFKREQLKEKQAFNTVLTRLATESKTEDQLVADLKELKFLTIKSGGLPAGLKKDDLVKQVRSKKAKGFWPTAVEYEYQALIREIAFQQSPNKDKDDANPL